MDGIIEAVVATHIIPLEGRVEDAIKEIEALGEEISETKKLLRATRLSVDRIFFAFKVTAAALSAAAAIFFFLRDIIGGSDATPVYERMWCEQCLLDPIDHEYVCFNCVEAEQMTSYRVTQSHYLEPLFIEVRNEANTEVCKQH